MRDAIVLLNGDGRAARGVATAGKTLRRFAILLACALAAGCTTGYDLAAIAPTTPAQAQPAPASAATAARAAHEVAVSHPRFGDRKPHPWSGRAPWTYAVHGTDVSKYQQEVDWKAAREAGISFVFVKATEGGDRLDDRFHDHWRGARAAGIPRAAYHFFYFCRPAREQAEWFIRHVPKEAGALPHVLDMEWNHTSPTCRLRPPADTVQREMRVFLETIERHYGKRPMIYTSIDFWEDNRLHEFEGYEWWLRSVSAHPHDRYDGARFRFWQYTGTGEVAGISGDADINVFNGSHAEWRDWLRRHTR